MDTIKLARSNGVQAIPHHLEYWPEKEVHRLITYDKELKKLRDTDPRKEELTTEMQTFRQEEDTKAKRYYDHLMRICNERIGPVTSPLPWTPIPELAKELWETEIYIRYRIYRFDYKAYMTPTEHSLTRRQYLGRRMLQIEDLQAKRIRREGIETLRKKATLTAFFCKMRRDARQVSPTQAELDEAWSQYEQTNVSKVPPGQDWHGPPRPLELDAPYGLSESEDDTEATTDDDVPNYGYDGLDYDPSQGR